MYFAFALIIQLSNGAVKPSMDMQHPYKSYDDCVASMPTRFAAAERIITDDVIVAFGCVERKEHKA